MPGSWSFSKGRTETFAEPPSSTGEKSEVRSSLSTDTGVVVSGLGEDGAAGTTAPGSNTQHGNICDEFTN